MCTTCALQASPTSWALANRAADWSGVDHSYEEELAYAAAMRGAAASASAEGAAAEVPPRRSQAATEEAGESKAAGAAGAAPRGGLVLCYGEVWEGGLAQLLESNDGGSEGGGGLCVRLSQGPSPSDCLATLLLDGQRVAEVALPSRAGAWLPLQLVVEPAGARLLYRRREVFAEPVSMCMNTANAPAHCKPGFTPSSVIYTSLMFAPHEHINRTSIAGRAARLGAGTALARFGGCRDARGAGRRLLGRQPAA